MLVAVDVACWRAAGSVRAREAARAAALAGHHRRTTQHRVGLRGRDQPQRRVPRGGHYREVSRLQGLARRDRAGHRENLDTVAQPQGPVRVGEGADDDQQPAQRDERHPAAAPRGAPRASPGPRRSDRGALLQTCSWAHGT